MGGAGRRWANALCVYSNASDGQVFHGPKGGRLKPDVARRNLMDKVVRPLSKQFPTPDGEVGFEHARLHSFRHFLVSQAFVDGASEGGIREWVGHADSRIVERYRHLSREDARRKMSKLDLLGNAATNHSPSDAWLESRRDGLAGRSGWPHVLTRQERATATMTISRCRPGTPDGRVHPATMPIYLPRFAPVCVPVTGSNQPIRRKPHIKRVTQRIVTEAERAGFEPAVAGVPATTI